MKTSNIFFILIFAPFSLFAQDLNNHKYNIKIKLTMSGADSTGGVITITKNGKPYKTIKSDGIDYFVDLNFNANYIIQCSKEKYLTKAVFFDTYIPNEREKEEFAKFTVLVNLLKQEKGVKVDSIRQVGGVCYIPEIKDFDKCNETR